MDKQDEQDLIKEGGHSCPPKEEEWLKPQKAQKTQKGRGD